MTSLSTRLTIPQSITFGDALVNLTTASGLADVALLAFIDKVSAKLAELTTAYNSAKTLSPLAALDVLRDDYFTRAYTYVTGYTAVIDDEKRAAAEKIKAVFDTYGLDTTRADYATESGKIKSLLEDLSGEAMLSAVSLLPELGALITALTQTEAEFKAKGTEYTQAKAADKSKDAAYLVKKELLEIINKQVLPYITVMSTADKTTWGAYATQVELAVTHANATVTRAKSTSDTSTNSDSSSE